jgi:hypothetical protein
VDCAGVGHRATSVLIITSRHLIHTSKHLQINYNKENSFAILTIEGD